MGFLCVSAAAAAAEAAAAGKFEWKRDANLCVNERPVNACMQYSRAWLSYRVF